MNKPYVEKRDDTFWVGQSRVSLDSIAYAFLNGQSAESIAQSFPVLTLEQIYGVITYYLAHRVEMDAYLNTRRSDFAAKRQASRNADPMFYQKLADAKRSLQKVEVA